MLKGKQSRVRKKRKGLEEDVNTRVNCRSVGRAVCEEWRGWEGDRKWIQLLRASHFLGNDN